MCLVQNFIYITHAYVWACEWHHAAACGSCGSWVGKRKQHAIHTNGRCMSTDRLCVICAHSNITASRGLQMTQDRWSPFSSQRLSVCIMMTLINIFFYLIGFVFKYINKKISDANYNQSNKTFLNKFPHFLPITQTLWW